MTVLTDHLPLLAGAPNGIKRLRELILDLAVRGKLAPQDPGDEPATELLEQIAERKAYLLSSGELKRQKHLAEIDVMEVPFDLPGSWGWARLGAITNFGSTSKVAEIGSDAWILDLEDIEKESSRLIQRKRFSERKSLSDKNSFVRGDVLYGKLRPYLNKVIVADSDGFCTTEIIPFRCHGAFNPHFLSLTLRSPYFLSYVNAKSYGMKMPRLGTEDGRQALVPIAPLAEQHRIVAKVDELMALCDMLEAQQADAECAHARLVQVLLNNLTQANSAEDFAAHWSRLSAHFDTLFATESSIDALKQTLLQLAVMGKLVSQDRSDEPANDLLERSAVGKAELVAKGGVKSQGALPVIDQDRVPYDLPQSWSWAWLSDVAFFQEGPGIMARDFRISGVPLIRIAGMRGASVSLEGCNFLDQEMVNKKWAHFRLDFGDIVLSSSASLGKISRVGEEAVGSILYTGLIRFKPYESLFYGYLTRFFGSKEFSRQIDESRTGAAIQHFGPTHLKSMLVPVPPLAEQHRIVAKVDELMALCDQLKTRLRQARDLNQQLATTLVERAVA